MTTTTTPKDPKKNAAKTLPSRAAIMAKANAGILKHTKQKPLQPSDKQVPHISTGSLSVDYLIGGSPAKNGEPICPGFPRRRITEVFGPESSGKTTLLLSAIVQAQRAGGCAFFIDFEHSLDHNYAKKVGVSYAEDKLSVFQPDTLEEGLKMIAIGIAYGVDLIGVDSVAAMVPKAELEKSFDEEARVGILAKAMSQALPKMVIWLQKHPMIEGKTDPKHPGTALVLLNQERALINTGGGGHGGDVNTAGGKALKFYAYMRLMMNRIKSEFIERRDKLTGKPKRFAYGNVTNVKVVKSKVDAKQGHSASVFIRYGFGIDDYYSIVETGVANKIIKKDGTYYAFGGERFQGKDKFRQYLIANPKVYDDLRAKILVAIMDSAVTAVDDDQLDPEDELVELAGDLDDLDEAMTQAIPTEVIEDETAEIEEGTPEADGTPEA